jgi:hypothetical protein
MKSIILGVTLLILASIALTPGEEVKLSPYTVSFELKNASNYTVKVNDPLIGNVTQLEPQRWNQLNIYSFDIIGLDKSFDRVKVLKYANSTDATLSTEIVVQELVYNFMGYKNITMGSLNTNKRKGFLMVASEPRSIKLSNISFTAWYWLDKVDLPNAIVSYGKQKVLITGNLSADLTQDLLNTISVKGT